MKLIHDLIIKTLHDLNLPEVAFSVSHPKEESHGDYSANVAMVLWVKNKELRINEKSVKSPRELAELIVQQLTTNGLQQTVIEKIGVAGPGFINFYLKTDFFLEEAKKATEPEYGKNELLVGQKTMVEFTDPNPFKEFHIGHLMSNTIGESLARLFEAAGAEVKRANYQGDVGLHVAKSVWGMLCKILNLEILNSKQIQNSKSEISNWITEWNSKSLNDRQKMMGQAYAYGATKYEEDETAKAEMNAMNKAIYDGTDPAINELYKVGRAWSLEYFEVIYKRLGTKFDEYFFESEAGAVGLKVIQEGLDKGVLEMGEGGAVVFKGEQYGLHTRVFRNALGLPTYEGKELGLAKTKFERYPYDKSYIVTANEIDEYFRVLLKVMNLLYPDLGAKTTHLSHGVMKLTSGKMSSRTGKIVSGEALLNELKEVVLTKIGDREIADKEVVADQVAVGALKYSVLKQAVGGDIVYEPDKMTNLEGNTGPFVQYAYARARSIIRRIGESAGRLDSESVGQLVREELSLLRWLYRYPEVVLEAGQKYAPHLVATYVYELAARFNSFYQSCRVEENGEVNQLRYLLTQASANVIGSGLNLLGIVAPSEM